MTFRVCHTEDCIDDSDLLSEFVPTVTDVGGGSNSDDTSVTTGAG